MHNRLWNIRLHWIERLVDGGKEYVHWRNLSGKWEIAVLLAIQREKSENKDFGVEGFIGIITYPGKIL